MTDLELPFQKKRLLEHYISLLMNFSLKYNDDTEEYSASGYTDDLDENQNAPINSERIILIMCITGVFLLTVISIDRSFHLKRLSGDYKSLMMNSSPGDLDATDNYYRYNNTSDSYKYKEETNLLHLGLILWLVITLITCCIGLVGNGYIIWLLGLQIKRNSFTTFILNLAIADFGYLTSAFIYNIPSFTYFEGSEIFYHFCAHFAHVMYINANFLLTAISIDRCVCVLFPIWHRCSRPKHLSSMVCILLWISSFLLGGIMSIMEVFGNYIPLNFHFLVTAIVCLPLITISTVVLFIKVCLKLKQKNQGRLLLMILITLLCFLILAFPLSVFAVICTFSSNEAVNQLEHWIWCSILFSCLNSSINPVIYFLVGRKKGAQSKESMKVILQKVFKEGEVTGER
ncbi:PREDICTED: mas-related G-protein coupled receptor member H-like [Thamnophis sirtalis]|uniref:Mas-related G-protein coupled receptor member H-like n=1 Tax=Thamnophis sirtalis TaxID=35019 RepID=A0A6I9YF93_9SAUR|nr:PREDICTED: mas-related G-protein coupled receptor member H-like [Thamnophis sirtalis]